MKRFILLNSCIAAFYYFSFSSSSFFLPSEGIDKKALSCIKNPLKWTSVYILQLIELRGGKGVDKSKTTSYRPKSANLTKRAVHLGNIEHIFSMTEPWCENQRRVYETPQLLPSPPERSETEGKEEKNKKGRQNHFLLLKDKRKGWMMGFKHMIERKRNAGWGWETKWWRQHNLWKFLTFPLCSRYT